MTLCSQRGRFGVGSREVRSGELLSEEWVAEQKNLGSSSLLSTSFGRRLGKYTHCAADSASTSPNCQGGTEFAEAAPRSSCLPAKSCKLG